MKISLDGTWQLAYFPEEDFQIAHPDQLSQTEMSLIPAHVPGNVELDRNDLVLAERVDRIGIRKLEVKRTEIVGAPPPPPPPGLSDIASVDIPHDPESHFLLIVNNVPIMIKGSNWVPLDAFHSRDAGRVDEAIALFDDLGCNMIRCWGGNVYEDHHFFDLCDENGILVWQDFAFACCRYPQMDEFLGQVRQEVQAVVEKLRNHPSLALWCGDNEIDMTYLADGLLPKHNRLTREVIPQVVHRCDPHRTYIPSSPYLSPKLTGVSEPDRHLPEQHLWGPRGYYKSPFYTQHTAHFIGEIGYHGCPNVSSIQRFISPEKLWPWSNNDEWQVHAVYHWRHSAIDRDRIALMANQIRELFGFIPDDLETFVLGSQITQAEAKKFFIESTRLGKWHTSGILWWNVLDGWPQFSDAIVDYYFGKKLAYHYIWRVQQPVCVMLGEPGAGKYLPVIVSNDSRSPAEVHYRVWNADSDETLVEGEITVPANQNWQVDRIRTYASDQRLYLIEWQVEEQWVGNHYLAGTPPFSLERYQTWLHAIAALPRPFEVDRIAG
ncbi:glycoside hydrolase family 2 TIM barrel-domain containing protein [Chloroflexota bacterium]